MSTNLNLQPISDREMDGWMSEWMDGCLEDCLAGWIKKRLCEGYSSYGDDKDGDDNAGALSLSWNYDECVL